jgi:hypothetical protein
LTAPTRGRPEGVRWNAPLARYIDTRGRIISTSAVRDAIDRSIEQYKTLARSLAEQLRGGEISLRTWESEMRVVVKDVQLLATAGAHGGWAQLDRAALGRAGREIRDQYAFLDNFAREISNGDQLLDGTLANRAMMYVEAGRGGYESQREAIEREAGYLEEISIRHASDSCRGCVHEASRGWVAIGSLVGIGDRDCLTRCRCTIERRVSESRAHPPTRRRRGPTTSRQRGQLVR